MNSKAGAEARSLILVNINIHNPADLMGWYGLLLEATDEMYYSSATLPLQLMVDSKLVSKVPNATRLKPGTANYYRCIAHKYEGTQRRYNVDEDQASNYCLNEQQPWKIPWCDIPLGKTCANTSDSTILEKCVEWIDNRAIDYNSMHMGIFGEYVKGCNASDVMVGDLKSPNKSNMYCKSIYFLAMKLGLYDFIHQRTVNNQVFKDFTDTTKHTPDRMKTFCTTPLSFEHLEYYHPMILFHKQSFCSKNNCKTLIEDTNNLTNVDVFLGNSCFHSKAMVYTKNVPEVSTKPVQAHGIIGTYFSVFAFVFACCFLYQLIVNQYRCYLRNIKSPRLRYDVMIRNRYKDKDAKEHVQNTVK